MLKLIQARVLVGPRVLYKCNTGRSERGAWLIDCIDSRISGHQAAIGLDT
jgi:hypothetical protein